MKNIGERIRYERLKKSLKQFEMAEQAGISNTYLSDIEIGRTSPSLKTLQNIAKVLGMECSDLMKEL